MNRTVILLLVISALAACSGEEANKPVKTTAQTGVVAQRHTVIQQDSLFPDAFTISKYGKPFLLDSLKHGYDSLQLRYWQEQGLYRHRRLYVIKNTAGKWSAMTYDLQLDSNYLNGNGSREFLTGAAPYYIRQSKQVTPSMGWQPFIDSLQALQVMTLPDSRTIAGMEVKWTHASGYYVEVATKNNYRFYSYYDPHRFADKFWQAENMLQIEALIQDQLVE